ncbi:MULTISPECIES: ParA family protein [Amycolatopsis]|uniref:Phage-related regulatory protein n=1 Tax=Amycolatopsis bullii TaxID=941987 RepID=A0ABQ3JXB7_9PSEU|nr:ParA family protein [Amycolatopsis bullii]GHF93279.1 phage-related regulatory protein [Amycolatopsis bullii]
MKSIAVFNNKGGVGKTTLLCNLAGFLALERGQRVLVVDADPQCNATQNIFSDEDVDNIYEQDNFTVDSIIKPLALGKGFSNELSPTFSKAFGVDVIPGDPRLALTEDVLASDWAQARGGETRGLRTSFAFTQLLERCQDYDLVMFDMGPSLGAINRSVLIGADFFVTPMSIDIFSLRAIDNIAISIKNWRKQLHNGLAQNENKDDLEVKDPRWKLQFLGYVTQQYTAKRNADGERRPVRAYDNIMNEVAGKIKDNFLDESILSLDDVALGSIPTFHSLIPMSQTSRKPIFSLRGADGVVGAHFAKVKEYHEIIQNIADRLTSNLGTLS